MDSKVVNKRVCEEIRPLLAALGFSQFTARTAWRYVGQRVDVINFQSFNSYNAGVLGITTYSFATNLGCCFIDIPYAEGEIKTKSGVLRPEEYECPFRGRLRRDLDQPQHKDRGIWFVDESGGNLQQVVEDARSVIARDAPPWFDQLGTHEAALRVLQEEDESMHGGLWGFGRTNSPYRNYLIGYFARALGRDELARVHLAAALASGCYDRVRPRIEADIQSAV